MLITYTKEPNVPDCYVICRVEIYRPAYGGISYHFDSQYDTAVEGTPTTLFIQTEADIIALAVTFGKRQLDHMGTDIGGCRHFLDTYAGRLFIDDPGYFD